MNQSELFYNISLPFASVLEDLEYTGLRVDVNKVNELKHEFEIKLDGLSKEIKKYTGDININSTQQLALALFGKLNINQYIIDYQYNRNTNSWEEYKDEFRTEGGAPSTDVTTLKKIMLIYKHPIAELLLEYRQINKLLSTYINGLYPFISPDNRVHPSYFALTKGFRISVSKPNTATIPSRSENGRKIKEIFIADTDDDMLVELDYAGIELRFFAWFSGSTKMYNAFFVDKLDVHALTTSAIFNILYEEAKINKQKRFIGKTINFLIVYGGSPYVLQQTLLKDDVYYNMKDCTKFINTYYDLYPDVRIFQETVKEAMLRNGYVETIYGRKRYFPLNQLPSDEKERNKTIRSWSKQAVSHVVQGSSTGEFSAQKTIELDKYLKQTKTARLWTLLYDGFYINDKKDRIKETAEQAKLILEAKTDIVKIDLPVDVSKIGYRWADL